MTPIALVTSVLARHDAISDSFLDLLGYLRGQPDLSVSAFAAAANVAVPELRLVPDAPALLIHPDFCAARVIVYEFGIFYDAFNALAIGNEHARQVVRFHNVTPLALASPAMRAAIERSFRQLYTLALADEVWAVSPENARIAREHGVAPARIVATPLSVRVPIAARLTGKDRSALRILFVSRFVAAKGAADLLEACAALGPHLALPLEVSFAGNESYSDPRYLAELRRAAERFGPRARVRILGTVDEARLARLLAGAHVIAVPSYHDGFGKTVIEGFAAGAIPVGYANAGLTYAADGLGRLVPVGDRAALAQALAEIAVALAAPAALPLDRGPTEPATFDRLAEARAALFSPAAVGAALAARIRALAQEEGPVRPLRRLPGLTIPQ